MPQEILHETLEREITELATELRLKQFSPEAGREALKAAFDERLKQQMPAGQSSQAQTSTTKTTSGVLPAYAKEFSPEQRLIAERFVDVALHQGISTAVDFARKEGPAILDLFHDTLTGRLYNLMKERGLI